MVEQADMGPELEIGKDYISREKEATLSVGEIGSPEKVSSSELVKGNKDKNQLEKVFYPPNTETNLIFCILYVGLIFFP